MIESAAGQRTTVVTSSASGSRSRLGGIARMADFCLHCVEKTS